MGVRDDLFPQVPYVGHISTEALEAALERLRRHAWGRAHFKLLGHEIQVKIARKTEREEKAQAKYDAIKSDRARARRDQALARPQGSSSSAVGLGAGMAMLLGGGPLTRTHAKQQLRQHTADISTATRLMNQLKKLARERGVSL